MVWFRILSYYIFYTVTTVTAQYTDDSEYNDFDFYGDLSTDKPGNVGRQHVGIVRENSYVMKTLNDKEDEHNEYLYSKDHLISFENTIDFFKNRDSLGKEFNWYKLPEKIYRYTKHRIPGYDYDEFDYMRPRSFQKCDDKSIWTHCLCQFTCLEPDVVDCYTPCRSGCECKEEYVFDEKTQTCLLPEHCPSKDNLNY